MTDETPRQKRRTDYQKQVAELRAQIVAAKLRAKGLRELAKAAINGLRERHKAWRINEQDRHRQLLASHRELLKNALNEVRTNRKVEAHVLVDNALRELQALRDDRARMIAKRKIAAGFREDEHGVYHLINDDPILLSAWRSNKQAIRAEWAKRKLKRPRATLEEAFDEYLQENSHAITEAQSRADVEHAKELEILARDQERQWRAGVLDPSQGAACEHPNAVRSLRGGRVCPDCGKFLKGGAPLGKPSKKKPKLSAVRARAEAKRRQRIPVQRRLGDVPF